MISEPFHNHTHVPSYTISIKTSRLRHRHTMSTLQRKNLIDMKRQVEKEEEAEKEIPTTNNGYNK